MKVGIMQPYFFPYIGYWQLIHAVDKFVIYDDVNFINRGWINRNKILINGEAAYFHLSLLGASQNRLICEIPVNPDNDWRQKRIKALTMAYSKAPFFKAVMPMLESIIEYKSGNAAEYIGNLIKNICEYIGIKTQIIYSSDIEKDNTLHGQDKILEICRILGATTYINAIGGRELYSRETFEKNKIKLLFINTKEIRYRQFRNEFVPNLSIIDVMMFNSPEVILQMLCECTFI